MTVPLALCAARFLNFCGSVNFNLFGPVGSRFEPGMADLNSPKIPAAAQ
jgi:hypothetical protein